MSSGTTGTIRIVRLGFNLGYWGSGHGVHDLELARHADDLGFSVVWASEAFSSDVVSVLSWVAARTRRASVGSAVMQIPARAPAMTAMTAATLDMLSGGRFLLGLGISGPQVSEGWYGTPFKAPLERTREYVEIVKATLARGRVTHGGPHYRLPLPGGSGIPLALGLPPGRTQIPLYLGALGPRSLELTGEIADGWLGLFVSPEFAGEQVGLLEAGRRKAGKTLVGFDVAVTAALAVGDDWRSCVDTARPLTALYLGGMGGRNANFYADLADRMGFGSQAAAVQDRFLAGHRDEALSLVPEEFIDATSLLGPRERIAERMQALAEVGVTTLNVATMRTGQSVRQSADAMRVAVEALDLAGLG